MLTDYIAAAMGQAVIEYVEEDRKFYGEIPPCRGVIGIGETYEQCQRDTQEALEGWIILGLRLGHALPVIDGIDLNEKEAA